MVSQSFFLYLAIWLPALVRSQDDPVSSVRRKDWSQKAKQFNLREHMLTPTSKDLREGIHNSRRLAKNAIQHGIDEEHHRELVAANPPSGLMTAFDQTLKLPSESYRIRLDKVTDPLPFGDGPGVLPGAPEGTKEFWSGGGNPKMMWEVVACPVADVDAFLANPMRCVFGTSTTGGIADFVSDLAQKDFTDVITNGLIPVAVEIFWSISPFKIIETLVKQVCSIFGIIEIIEDVVSAIGDFGGDIIDGVGDFFSSIFRRRLATGESANIQCTGHKSTCEGDDATCKACLQTPDATCDPKCGSCWQPLESTVPDMEGLCIPTATLRKITTETAPFPVLQMLYNSMVTLYQNANDDELFASIVTALGTDGTVNNSVSAQINDAKTHVTNASADIKGHVDNTCKAKTSSGRRLGEATAEDFEQVLRSSLDQDGKSPLSGIGISGDQIDSVIKGLGDKLSKVNTDALKKKLEKAYDNPEYAAGMEKLAESVVKQNQGKIVNEVVGRFLKDGTNPQTGRFQRRRLGLEDDCNDFVDSIVTEVKALMTDGLTKIYEGLDEIFPDIGGEVAAALIMPLKFMDTLNAVDDGSPLNMALGVIIDAVQEVGCIFLFGSTGDKCNGVLPSKVDKVLPIYETRDGKVFMNSGCDSNFEGELLYADVAASAIITILDNVVDSIIEFFNIPVAIVRYLVQVVQTLYSHMNNVCSYLDAYVQLSEVEASFENSRYILHEVACRTPENITLQKGYGCDGIDNTCDDDKQIDECAEDIFPPEIDHIAALTICGGDDKYFANFTLAETCVAKYTTAVDECKPVTTSVSSTAGVTCSGTVSFTAVAQGCGERAVEDTTTVDIPVKIDGTKPVVSCTISEQTLSGNGAGVYKDIGFTYTATDNCGASGLGIKFEVLCNEMENDVLDMVIMSDDTPTPTIFAQDYVCKSNSGTCKVSSSKKSRKYQVRVTATDAAGNSASATCETVVGGSASDGPMMLLTSKEFTLA